MIGMGRLTRYSEVSTLSMLLLVLSAFLPGYVVAQAPCEEALQRIYRITETEAQHVPDSLQTVLDLASLVRECQEDRSLELELWLLNNEVFVLDGLGRYEVADGIVGHFFNTYFERASDYYRARLYRRTDPVRRGQAAYLPHHRDGSPACARLAANGARPGFPR